MQLALTAYVLVLLGAGAFVLLAVLVVVLRRARRRQPDTPEPTASDWTGEAATGDPSVWLVPVAVADAPLSAAPPPVVDAEPTAAPVSDAPDPVAQEPVAQEPVTLPDGPASAEPRVSDDEPAVLPTGDHNGSGRSIAAAVAQVLAARAAAEQAGRAVAPAPDGDVRDRLLAVLLDDPACAVGATVELEACRDQLDRLSDAVRHQRSALADVLDRLSGAGLAPEQLSRLSGLPIDDVHELLAGARSSVS